jgi:bacterioferritin-associated ferredoxin
LELIVMIVCSCNVLSEQEVRSAVCPEGGMARTAVEVYSTLGCRAQCGRCARTIKSIINEALSEGCGTSCTRVHHADASTSPLAKPACGHSGHAHVHHDAPAHDAA